jgi:2,4-dienoyl-CoA reductase-like NADH-dependent reductase (Old Yellow Enzyme family)
MASLFDPLSIRSVTFRNRLGVSPMCMYSSEDGVANDWHLVHLGSRAVGGYGLVIAEATAVTPEGRISPDDAGIWADKHIEPLARINRFIKAHGAAPGVQLAHAGRKASTARPWGHEKPNAPVRESEGGWQTVAPSAVAYAEGHVVPRALTVEEIAAIRRAFVDATKRSLQAGYEVIELHGAHGYLINEFLSPLANRRTDHYGGSFENRIRFLMELIADVRKLLPEGFPLLLRISATDWVEGGWTLEDSVALARRVKPAGVDLIDCSSGAVVPAKIAVGPGYQVPFAEAVKKGAGILTAAVGMITEPAQAAAIVTEGQADMVFMAREALRDPYFPLHAARALGRRERVHLPGQYLRA